MGRCPCTPSVARHVGTRGKRAASGLSKTPAPTGAVFARRQRFPHHARLLGGASQKARRRPIRASAMARTAVAPRGALALDSRSLIPGDRPRCIGPGGALASTPLGTAFHPPLERRRARLREPPRPPGGPVERHAQHALLTIWRAPAPSSGTMHAHLLGDRPTPASATRPPDRRTPIAQPAVTGGFAGGGPLSVCRCRPPSLSPLFQPPHEQPHERVPPFKKEAR